jgi:hypothetical protein
VGGIVLQVSTGCSSGAAVQISPTSAGRITSTVTTTTDGQLAGLVIAPAAKAFNVIVTHAGGVVTVVRVHL